MDSLLQRSDDHFHSTRAALRLIGDAEMPIVLIVDDYPVVRKTLRSLLEKLGSVVCIEAINGRDAIAKTEASSPDLIIFWTWVCRE